MYTQNTLLLVHEVAYRQRKVQTTYRRRPRVRGLGGGVNDRDR